MDLDPLIIYKEAGLDMYIYFYDRENKTTKKVTLHNISDDGIKDKLTHYNMLVNKGNDTRRYKSYIYIFLDVQQKRRFEKIKKIKDKITHDNTIKTI